MHCNYVIHNNNSWVLKECTSSQLLTSFILWHTSSTYAMTHLDSKTSVYPQSLIITPLFLWPSWFLQWCFPCGIYNAEFKMHSFLLIAAILYNCRAWPRGRNNHTWVLQFNWVAWFGISLFFGKTRVFLPVGSKSWDVLRSTFCFLSVGDSRFKILPCLS